MNQRKLEYFQDIATGRAAMSALNDHIHIFAKHQGMCALLVSEKTPIVATQLSNIQKKSMATSQLISTYNFDIEDCEQVTKKLYNECTVNFANVAHTMALTIKNHKR